MNETMTKEVMPSRPTRGKRLAPKPKKKWTPWFLLAVVILLGGSAALLCASYLNWIELPTVIQARIDLMPDLSAKNGVLEEQEVAAESYRLSVNVLPTVAAGKRTCNVQFENALGNHYDARLLLYLADTGELVGNTHRVAVGKRVESLELNRALPPGEYALAGQVELFEGDTRVSVMPVELTLRVTEGGN